MDELRETAAQIKPALEGYIPTDKPNQPEDLEDTERWTILEKADHIANLLATQHTWQILDASGNFKVAVGDLKSSQYPWKTQEYTNMKLDDIVETPAFLEAFRRETTDMLPGEQARILEQISEKLANGMNESTRVRLQEAMGQVKKPFQD